MGRGGERLEGPVVSSSDLESRLADLRALTEARLVHLDLDDLLAELLARTIQILDADTAAVLLLDEASNELVARAARGVEEEVHQGVRVPVGAGFAGRVAASRAAIRLDRVDATTVTNPILWETGIKVMLGVPLLAGDDVVGVLHVGRHEDRAFSADDAELLQVVAERVAAATQSGRLAVERAAAQVLERSLLPGRLPNRPGIEFGARYVPAAGRMVGGDWYDAFQLPSGELWVVTGDVAGHSLHAAVIMGRVRSALRAYALLELPPHDVLRLVDRKIDLFELDTTVTIACAVMTPPFDRMQLTVAGHPLPVIAPPEGDPIFAVVDADPLLGVGGDAPRRSTEVLLPTGSTVVFYTDGLIERRHEPLDVGLERLRTTVYAAPPGPLLHHIMRQMVGNIEPEDDIAVLAFRTTNAEGHYGVAAGNSLVG